MRLGFDTAATSPARRANTARASQEWSRRVLEREDVGGGQVTVLMEGSTAVLTGTVASEHARDVLESLAMLEPGIAEVRNELLVNPARAHARDRADVEYWGSTPIKPCWPSVRHLCCGPVALGVAAAGFVGE